MRLALVTRSLSTLGGTERFVHGLARFLVEQGDRVEVYCLDAPQAPRGVGLRPIPAPRLRGRLPRMLSLALGAGRVPRDEHDLVLGFLRAPGFDLWRAGGGCHADWLDAAPRISGPVDRIELALDRRAAWGARRVVVNSQLGAAGLQRHYKLPAERIFLVRNGVDLGRFQPVRQRSPPIPRPAVAFLGNGWERKGLSTAIEAVARLPGVHLGVHGQERRPRRWKEQARMLGIAERVHFPGPLARPEDLLPHYDAFLLPTRYDASANASLEALACGVPVVTSALDGAAEVLPDPGLVVPDPSDSVAFALALERALHEPALREAARAAASLWPAETAYSRLRALAQELCR